MNSADEGFLGIDARRIVRDHRHHFFDPVVRRPIRHRHGRLRQREAGARDVGGFFGDDGRAGRGDDLGGLRLRRQRRDRERGRRDAKAGQEIHLVVDDQFLSDALGIVGNRGVVANDELDLLAGDHVAMLRHVKLDRRRLPACRSIAAARSSAG